MGIDASGLAVAVISVTTSILFTLWFTRLQTRATQRQADAATEQVAIARDQAVSARDAAETAQRQLALAEQVRREQVEPYVVVDIRPSDHVNRIFLLVIENIGPTVARNVRVHFEPPLARVGESDPSRRWKPIRDSSLLTSGIPTMPPGHRMEWIFDVTHERLSSNLPVEYTVTVDADGPIDKVETLTYKIDLRMYGGLNKLGVKGLHDGVKSLDKLVQATNSVAARLERLSRPSSPEVPEAEPGDE